VARAQQTSIGMKVQAAFQVEYVMVACSTDDRDAQNRDQSTRVRGAKSSVLGVSEVPRESQWSQDT